MVHDSL